MTQYNAPDLDRLFFPQSIAVVGASPKTGMRVQGNNYIKGSISLDFKGKIYPVHPQAKSILGFDAYPSVRDIPGEVDLVIFSMPAKNVLSVMEDCVAKRVRFVHSFTAGFSETGIEEFAAIEEKLVAMAKEAGIRLVGPNCMGVYCPEGGLSFQPFLPETAGPVGFFSQSGQFAGMFVMKGAALGLRFSKVVSFGNASDLKAHEFLAYLGKDEKTKIIGSYLEGLKDGREFFQIAGKVTRKNPWSSTRAARPRADRGPPSPTPRPSPARRASGRPSAARPASSPWIPWTKWPAPSRPCRATLCPREIAWPFWAAPAAAA